MGKPTVQQMKKTLTLKEKVDIIKYKDKSGCGSRSLAEKFFIGITQILSILKTEIRFSVGLQPMNLQNKKVLVKQVMKKLTN